MGAATLGQEDFSNSKTLMGTERFEVDSRAAAFTPQVDPLPAGRRPVVVAKPTTGGLTLVKLIVGRTVVALVLP